MQYGPASAWVKSSTFKPCSALLSLRDITQFYSDASGAALTCSGAFRPEWPARQGALCGADFSDVSVRVTSPRRPFYVHVARRREVDIGSYFPERRFGTVVMVRQK